MLVQLVRAGDLDAAEIRDRVTSLLGAGFDTTASTLAWTLWEARPSPGPWSRLRERADEALGAVGDTDETALVHGYVA